MCERDAPPRSVLGLVVSQPALHVPRRQLLETQRSERWDQVAVDGASVASDRAGPPVVFVVCNPFVQELLHGRRARQQHMTIGRSSMQAFQLGDRVTL